MLGEGSSRFTRIFLACQKLLPNIPGVNGLPLPTRGLSSSNKLLDVSEPGGPTIRPCFLSGEEQVKSPWSTMAAEARLFLLAEYLAVMVSNLASFYSHWSMKVTRSITSILAWGGVWSPQNNCKGIWESSFLFINMFTFQSTERRSKTSI